MKFVLSVIKEKLKLFAEHKSTTLMMTPAQKKEVSTKSSKVIGKWKQ